ncbi:hypothetical protein RD792_003090 [Penstemon davidsonii]|uniref:Late embryogenesis abundant protein LEA-2 subgroup domain-containing protein n=1 Tax=Penstemon davidsonii TaxID=160366 RepID=A0ABR0DSV8_9LAMI|nr:hypothetical protein RD792_003090 [Penstemon davidsonii]
MEDPNRPVTGYPAPPNGHSSNRPPSYPYPNAAAAPPYTAYSNYNNNPYYQPNYPDADSVRSANCLRRIFAFVIALVVIFGTITFIVWLVLRPQLPEFRVDSLSLSNFTLTNNSLVSFTSEIRLTAQNPNKKMRLVYEQIEAAICYERDSLSQTTLPPFSQDTKNETSLTANFAAAGSFVKKRVVDGVNRERGEDGTVKFNLRMISTVRFVAKAWRTRRRFLKVFCGNLMVAIPGDGRFATLTGGSRRCQVGI